MYYHGILISIPFPSHSVLSSYLLKGCVLKTRLRGNLPWVMLKQVFWWPISMVTDIMLPHQYTCHSGMVHSMISGQKSTSSPWRSSDLSTDTYLHDEDRLVDVLRQLFLCLGLSAMQIVSFVEITTGQYCCLPTGLLLIIQNYYLPLLIDCFLHSLIQSHIYSLNGDHALALGMDKTGVNPACKENPI